MMNPMVWQLNRLKDLHPTPEVQAFHPGVVQPVQEYHATLPGYRFTPLHPLSTLARHWNLGGLFIKDESSRFGLNAFKSLGGTYAVAKYLSRTLDHGQPLTTHTLTSPGTRQRSLTFATATDGNHGVGIAWAAHQFGHQSIVFMPRGTAAARVQSVRAAGGQAEVTAFNYDDTVAWVAAEAAERGWVLVQDTSWPGYQEIPLWIMQGYTTLIYEALQQLQDFGVKRPTHVFLQAGVGSFAAAVTGFLANVFASAIPLIIVVEPTQTASLLRSATVGDGQLHSLEGPMQTVMAGLACGAPNPLAWDILQHWVGMFLSCPDEMAARGTRILANPLAGDPAVISGESGSVTLGVLSHIMASPLAQTLRQSLDLNEQSQVLLVSTEGMTDPVLYRRLVWDGLFPYDAS
ncbi:MAG: diaminopropionate ammonia-lyase [Thermaerobacter sp.]|nr:diaminopropionate ammonia-lyase [Thermaerobacter sp.]